MPKEINDIISAIGTIESFIIPIATALVVLMIMVAGLYIVFDRDISVAKRGERLAFIRSILIGYTIILGANLLVTVLIHALMGISGHGTPPVPIVPVPGAAPSGSPTPSSGS